MRKFVVAIMIVICFLLQSTVFTALNIGGIVPNLMIILTASVGFMRGEQEGLIIGFVCGLLWDVFYGDFLGFYAMVLMYIGFLNGKFSRSFYPEDIKLPIALIIVSDLTFGVLCYGISFLLRGKFDFTYYLLRVILPEALYTTVITLFLYPLILKINNALEARERRSAQKFV